VWGKQGAVVSTCMPSGLDELRPGATERGIQCRGDLPLTALGWPIVAGSAPASGPAGLSAAVLSTR